MQIVVKNQALDNLFQMTAEEFHARRPQMAASLREHTRQQSALLRRQNGFSADGNLMLLACIPQYIYAVVRELANRHLGIDDVWRDPKNLRRFLRIWRDCNVKRKPKMWSSSPSRPASSARTAPLT